MFKQKFLILSFFIAVMIGGSFTVFASEEGSKDAILEELDAFIDKTPEILRNVIFSMGDQYSRENKIDEAVGLYKKALKVFPDDEDFLSRLGDLYNRKPDYAASAEIYKKLTELNPENVWYFTMLSSAYKNAGQQKEAMGVWDALTKRSNNADIFMQAANFYSMENDMDKAISAAKKASEIAPENIGYLQNLVSFYMRAEKTVEAETVCDKIIKLSQDAWAREWANSELINIYQRKGKLEDLAKRFEKELSQTPKDVVQYRKLADLYQRSDQRDKAIEVYKKAVSSGIGDRDIDNRLLDLYEWTGKFDEAEAQIRKMILSYPGESYLYERLANILVRAEKQDEAKKVWQEYLAKVPNDAGAFSRFGDSLNQWGDVNGAIEQYRKAQSLDPKNLWYTMRVADILIGKERFGEAKRELNTIIAKATDDWMKQEAERRISDIDNRQGAKAQKEEVVKKEEKPKKKSRGLFR